MRGAGHAAVHGGRDLADHRDGGQVRLCAHLDEHAVHRALAAGPALAAVATIAATVAPVATAATAVVPINLLRLLL